MGRAYRRAGLVVAGALALAAGCGGGSQPEGGGGTTITIRNYDYSPRRIDVTVGQTVTVVNRDSASHSVTAEDTTFDTGAFGKQKRTLTLSVPGTYTYFCTVHPSMPRGVVHVSA